MEAVPLPVEVVISGSEINSEDDMGDEMFERICVVRSMDPAAQSAFNSFAKGKNLVVIHSSRNKTKT
jgi:hypothetical protein